MCEITELEVLRSARSSAHHKEMEQYLGGFYAWLSIPDDTFQRARQVQQILVEHGEHRSAGPVDLLVAAVAGLSGLILLHCDRDFEAIARHTGQPTLMLTDGSRASWPTSPDSRCPAQEVHRVVRQAKFGRGRGGSGRRERPRRLRADSAPVHTARTRLVDAHCSATPWSTSVLSSGFRAVSGFHTGWTRRSFRYGTRRAAKGTPTPWR